MRRRVGDGDEVAKKRHREGRKLDDPIGAARRRRLAAVRRQDDLDRLSRELSEAHEHLAAASEVLGIISRSPRDAQPVFDAIVQSAARLCGTAFSIVHLYDGESVYLAATNNLPPEALTLVQMLSAKPDRTLLAVRAIVDRAIVHVPDVLKDPDYPRELAVAGGWRAVLAVPMLRNGAPVGAISVGKVEPGPFSDRQVRLLGIFADQAVIAIENTRLFEEVQARRRDLTEALEQQTATSAILRVISTSPTEAQPVFETIVRNAVALCGSLFANVCRFDGELLHFVASHNVGPSNVKLLRAKYPMRPDSSQVAGRVVLTKSVVRLEDTLADPDYDRQFAAAIWRRILGVPMLRQGEPVGVIIVGWAEAGPVPKAQEELLKQFADQAVIAIENARMFEEVETRTRELELRTGELTETLQQQTATAEVLKVISRSAFDLDAVLQALLDSAIRLCAAPRGHIFIYDGEFLRFAVASGAWPGFIEYLRDNPIRPGKGSVSGRAASDRRIVHVHDVLAESGYEHTGLLRQQGFRTVLAVPMLRDEALLGVIALLKSKVEPFTERQIELVATFADQAVIALENARLLDELQQSTREVREALEYQTAISDVLGVISRSPSDVQPVFDAIVQCASRLLFTGDFLFVGDVGRPDLLGPEAQQRLAHELYGSVFERMADLPDFLELFPAHGAGSLCGKAIGSRESSTLGFERRFAPSLQRLPEADWVAALLRGMPVAPPYFRRMKRVNSAGPRVIGPELPGRKGFTAKEVHERVCADCLILDVRPKEAFAAAHIPGSINIPFGPHLATWAGWVLPYERPILAVVDEPEEMTEIARCLLRVGFDEIQGYVEGGVDAWEGRGYELAGLEAASVHDLAGRLRSGDRPFVLDVRTEQEWEGGHIEGAHHIHGGLLQDRLGEVPRDREVAVVCGSGYRASIAASFLKRAGYEAVSNVIGGMTAWTNAGLPVAK